MEHRCRQCESRDPPAPSERVTPGKPFDECPGCGAYVTRGQFREWDTMAAAVKARIVIAAVRATLLAGLLAGSGYALWAIALHGGAKTTGTLVALGLGIAVCGAWRGFWLIEAIQHSRRRMSDPMYTARLVQFELERRQAELSATLHPST